MPTFTETSTLHSLEIFPSLNVINVKRLNTTFKDGVKFTEQTDAKSYSTSQFSDFEMEVSTLGGTLLEIVEGFSQAALDAASSIPATLAAKDAEIATATTAHTATLAAKDTQIAALQAQIDAFTPAPPATGVVTMRQARLALLQVGKYADVGAAIASMPEPQKTAATIEWEYANTVERSSAFVASMAGALNLTEEEMDNLFALAETL